MANEDGQEAAVAQASLLSHTARELRNPRSRPEDEAARCTHRGRPQTVIEEGTLEDPARRDADDVIVG
eukprot:5359016-Prymnesium_polylepis.1